MLHRWWVLSAVACGTFMATLDSSIVNIALPTLTSTFNTQMVNIKWVVIVYLLVITCLLLPFGRLSDEYGRKRVFQIGFGIFTISSALCGFAPDLTWLLLARVLQGLGAAMLMANGPAIITASFPGSERGKALGTLAMVVSAGLVTGPSLGGFLITTWGWRSIFLVNLPVGFAGIFLANRFVANDQGPKSEAPFDWAGAFLQFILLLGFIIVVEPPAISISGGAAVPISRLAIAVFILVVLVVFIQVERQAKAPLFDLSLLKIQTYWTANLAGFLTFVAYSSMSYLMPFFLEKVLKLTPDKAGLMMTAIPLTIFVVAPISGRISDRIGSRELSIIGALVGAVGLFGMAGSFGEGIHANMSGFEVVLGLCSIGLAIGVFQSPNNNAIMGVVPQTKLGVASALLATVRNLGLVTGTGLATALFSWRESVTKDFVASFHFTLFASGLVALGAVAASFGKKRGQNFEYIPTPPARE